MNELEVSKATAQAAAKDATKAMEAVEALRDDHKSPDPEMTRRFLIKGLDPGEQLEPQGQLLNDVTTLLEATGVNVRPSKVERRGFPGLVIVTMNTVAHQKRVIRLKGNVNYARVFAFPDQPRADRIIYAKIGQIVSAIPTLEWKKNSTPANLTIGAWNIRGFSQRGNDSRRFRESIIMVEDLDIELYMYMLLVKHS